MQCRIKLILVLVEDFKISIQVDTSVLDDRITVQKINERTTPSESFVDHVNTPSVFWLTGLIRAETYRYVYNVAR